MFEIGRAEALSWAQEVGFPEAARKTLTPTPSGAPAPASAATSISMGQQSGR